MKSDVQNTPPQKMKFWDKFFTMFYEDDSEWWSSIRFGFIFMMLLSNFCVWLTWVVICAIKGEVVAIPESVLGLYGIANGIGFGSKVRQKGKELSSENEMETIKNAGEKSKQILDNEMETIKNDAEKSKQTLDNEMETIKNDAEKSKQTLDNEEKRDEQNSGKQ